MLDELYSANPLNWDVPHLVDLVRLLAAEKWAQGLQAVFKSLTTEMLINTQPYENQQKIMIELFKIRKDSPVEIAKIFDNVLADKKYCLIAIYTLLKD